MIWVEEREPVTLTCTKCGCVILSHYFTFEQAENIKVDHVCGEKKVEAEDIEF